MRALQAQAWTARLALTAAVPAVPAAALTGGYAMGNPIGGFYAGAVVVFAAGALLGPLAWPAQSRQRSAEMVAITAVIGWVTALDGYIASLALSWPAPTATAPLVLGSAVYLGASAYAFAGGGEHMRLTWPLAPVVAAAAWLAAGALL